MQFDKEDLHFAKDLPGDVDKIITNGTSAGGALVSQIQEKKQYV